MIPKKVHYVWLGGGKQTPSVTKCINSWRKVMPDYEIKCWSENNFDIDSVPWVKEAIEHCKWSLASDYIRHYAIYTEGGIYMDTDVMVYKSFDEFLNNGFFTSVEFHPALFEAHGKKDINQDGVPSKEGNEVCCLGMLAALFGAEKGNPFIKECMDFFGTRHFVGEDGGLFMDLINPSVMPMLAVKHGFRYIDKEQIISNGIHIYPSWVFAGNSATRRVDSYSMHFCDSSWRDYSFPRKIKRWLVTHYPALFRKM